MKNIIAAVMVFCLGLGFLDPVAAQTEQDAVVRVARAALPAEERKESEFKVFRGDINDDGKPDAVVFAYYAFPGGNATGVTILVLENTGEGFKVVARPKDTGDEPRNFRFGGGRVSFDLTVARPNDPRCCPTGKRTVTVRLRGGSSPPSASSDLLAQRWCDFPSEIERKNGNLEIDLGGESMTFRNVRFDGCRNDLCRYSQQAGNRWTVRRIGDSIEVKGPIIAGNGFERVTLTFGKNCK